MAKKQFSFFSTKSDLLSALYLAAEKAKFNFACLADGSNVPDVYQAATELDDLSIGTYGNQSNDKLYLFIEPESNPIARQVEQRNGGFKSFFDQLSHPASVAFRPGGLINSSNCIIAGQIGTTTDEGWSNSLYKILFSSFKKRFTKIKSFYVGPEAEKKLDEGWRLTTNIKSPEDYDLKR
ncbi:hypothetical protein [Agarilytica rhodophyticola]|uniref:hypothetical protein n=1 Tax=Agarilytica rhodophyticola TaxID=1737490 RepID=UPI00131564B6|nr:hypothetical protein [Agarilytica rhodophyticola]